jgi:hypothetical protein
MDTLNTSTKFTRILIALGLTVMLLGSMLSPVMAQAPVINDHPPVPQGGALESNLSVPDSNQTAPLLSLPVLKAVLVVGEIDGPTGSWTLGEVANSNLVKTELEANGVQVTTFYPPIASWDAVRTAAEGAHFFMYRGHGVSWGGTPLVVGGMYLGPNIFVSSDQIRSGLHLAPNAIVMLYGCFTAGTSSSDTTSITLAEAKRRTAMYSDPFFDNGAGGYFADWFGDAFQMYVRYLFQGMTQLQAYQAYFDYNASQVNITTHPDHPELPLWLGWDVWDNKTQYNNAFAGVANATLVELFNTKMVVTPDSASVITSVAAPALPANFGVYSTTTLNFNWTATLTVPNGGTWASLSTPSGASGSAATVVLNPAGLTPGTYSASLRVQSSQPGVLLNDQTVPVTLVVAEQVTKVFIPMVKR